MARGWAVPIVVVAALAALAAGAQPGASTGVPVDVAWRFMEGAPDERRLAGRVPDALAGGAEVRLPHRVLRPNHSLWYGAVLDLRQGDALLVDADDGAQVFVGGRQVTAVGRIFVVPHGLQGRRVVTIRVLNNAMAGGLRSVRRLSAGEARVALAPAAPLPPVSSVVPGAPAFERRMPGPDRPCRFTAWADSQGGLATFGRIVQELVAHRSDVSIAAGDLVDDGSSPRAWAAWLGVLAPLVATTPVALVAGNHDYDGFYDTLRADHYLAVARPYDHRPWFAWSCGPVRFMAIDVNTEFPIGVDPSSAQGRWIVREASSRAWRDARWRVLVVHQPPWSRSWAGYEGDEAVRAWVRRLSAGGGLDLVIAGHSHAYERLVRQVDGRPVQVLITGGAGGTLEDAAAGRLDGDEGGRVVVRHHFVRGTATTATLAWEAVDLEGRVLDRHEIRPPIAR